MAEDSTDRHDGIQDAEEMSGRPSELPVEMLQEIVSTFRLQQAAHVKTKALDESTLPASLQRALMEYRKLYPRRSVKPLVLRTMVDGEPVVELGAGKLPLDEKLVTFAVTESVISSVDARVVSNVLFAQRG